MKVFLSSVIAGFEPYREAAARAALALRHDVRRAEEFPASPESPQQACLAGVRWADVVILIIGARYGALQKSGLSATHEEYREARGRRQVLAFIEHAVEREPAQKIFEKEVRDWVEGVYTADFSSADELRDAVVRALHEIEICRVVATADEGGRCSPARLP